MTAGELLAHIEQQQAIGGSVITVKLARRCTGARTRIMPGVTCRVVQWGDGTWTFPSVAMCDIADIEARVRALAAVEAVAAAAVELRAGVTAGRDG